MRPRFHSIGKTGLAAVTMAAATAVAAAGYLIVTPGGGSSDRDLVNVADQGFSIVSGTKLTYAFVIENRSERQALEGARYEARFFGMDGGLITERSGEVPLVLPLAQVAVAEESIEVAARPSEMTVTIVGGEMRRAQDLPQLLSAGIRAARSPGLEGGKADATAELWNPYGAELADVYVASVYRDATGSIIGGSSKVVARFGPGAHLETVALENAPGASQVLQSGERIAFPARPTFYAAPTGSVAKLSAVYRSAQAQSLPPPPVVKWVPAEPPVYRGPEDPFPFTAGRTPVSMVYVVDGDAEPRLIYETGRWLYTVDWHSGDVLSFGLRSRKVDPPPEGRGPFYIPVLTGTLGLTTGGEPVWEFTADSPDTLVPSPDDRQVALHHSGREIFLLRQDGHAFRLEGLGERVAFVGWAPGGGSILVFSYEQVVYPLPVDGVFYIVPVVEGPAIRLYPPATHFQRETASWSPDGSRIAFVAGAEKGPLDSWQSRGDLYVFELDQLVTRRLTSGPAYGSTRPRWSESGRYLTIEGDLIDVASGDIVRLREPPVGVTGGKISPSERYFVVSEDPFVEAPHGCPRDSLRNRTHLLEINTRRQRTLLDCGDGFFVVRTWDYTWGSSERWLGGGRYLVVDTPNCYACEGYTIRLTHLDLETGVRRTILERSAGRLDGVASPDGRRLGTTGDALRIFDERGELLRTIALPEGYEVQNIAWSPDGSSLAYIVVPIGLFDWP
ncbi:MAG TPA: hypothetical protein VNN10_03355 [Dehalococcoidia bacterium]|nr:hypothetical protein [Dehalococcoidia bacterium]